MCLAGAVVAKTRLVYELKKLLQPACANRASAGALGLPLLHRLMDKTTRTKPISLQVRTIRTVFHAVRSISCAVEQDIRQVTLSKQDTTERGKF